MYSNSTLITCLVIIALKAVSGVQYFIWKLVSEDFDEERESKKKNK